MPIGLASLGSIWTATIVFEALTGFAILSFGLVGLLVILGDECFAIWINAWWDGCFSGYCIAEVPEMLVLKRLLIVSLFILVLAAGVVVVLGPERLHPVSLLVTHPSPGLATVPSTGQGVHGYVSIGPLSPLCSIVPNLGKVSDDVRSIEVVARLSSGENVRTTVEWMSHLTCDYSSMDSGRVAPGPAAVGTYNLSLVPGEYMLTLSVCELSIHPLGCGVLPEPATVSQGSFLGLTWLLILACVRTGFPASFFD
ncbi:MAG TPA: hypothetical protein VE177_03485 [Candidatus Binatus sp.]|nr:hypothetical protein [Candidatus Binatus sp.]